MSFTSPPLPDPIRHAAGLSRYLGRMLDSRPWLAETLAASLAQPLDADAMQAFLARRALS